MGENENTQGIKKQWPRICSSVDHQVETGHPLLSRDNKFKPSGLCMTPPTHTHTHNHRIKHCGNKIYKLKKQNKTSICFGVRPWTRSWLITHWVCDLGCLTHPGWASVFSCIEASLSCRWASRRKLRKRDQYRGQHLAQGKRCFPKATC